MTSFEIRLDLLKLKGRINELRCVGTPLQSKPQRDIIEARANNYIKLPNGKMNGSKPRKNKGTKYAPSPQRNTGGIQLGQKRYARLCGTLGTLYPGLKKGETRIIRDAKYQYEVEADGYGGFKPLHVRKLK